jgi:hypothetical protein
MKNIDKFKKHPIKVMIFLIISLCYLNTSAQKDGQIEVGVINKSSHSKANDLHIGFDREVGTIEVNPDSAFKNIIGGNDTIHLASGITGKGVQIGDTVVLTIHFTGTDVPHVTKFFFTENGNIEDTTHTNRLTGGRAIVGIFDFPNTISTGNGIVEITVADITYPFVLPPGLTGSEVATIFADFVDDEVNWLTVDNIVSLPNSTELTVYPSFFNGDIFQFTVNINPDSTQEVSFEYLGADVIPTLSQWGLIILLLLVLAVGMVFLHQRQASLELAGVAEASSARPKLFDGKLYAKVFAIVLLIGTSGLIAAYLYFGQITNADPFGVFVSAAVVAYMVQLWMMRKESRG